MSHLFHRTTVWIPLQHLEALIEEILDTQTLTAFIIDLGKTSFQNQ